MARIRTQRSDKEWQELILESRRSGLTDAEWCRKHDIPLSTFYNAGSRLRKKACDAPGPPRAKQGKVRDLTAGSPDVVPILIEPEETPATTAASSQSRAAVPHIDNSHMIEILMGGTCIRIRNGADPLVLSAVITAVGRASC